MNPDHCDALAWRKLSVHYSPFHVQQQFCSQRCQVSLSQREPPAIFYMYGLSVPVCGGWGGGGVYDFNIESMINLAGNAIIKICVSHY